MASDIVQGRIVGSQINEKSKWNLPGQSISKQPKWTLPILKYSMFGKYWKYAFEGLDIK